MSCNRGLSSKQADYVYGKCKIEKVVGTKQVYGTEKCKANREENSDFEIKCL